MLDISKRRPMNHQFIIILLLEIFPIEDFRDSAN